MRAGKNKVVTLAYELSVYGQDDSLHLLEKKAKESPVEFILGNESLLPAVEKALDGQTAGFHRSLELIPEDAFGAWKPKLETWQAREKFPAQVQLVQGMKFQTQGPDGEVISVMVKEIEPHRVLLDGNHPLAGLKVRFDVSLLRVREATAEELAKNQVLPNKYH